MEAGPSLGASVGGRAGAAINCEELELTYWLKEDASGVMSERLRDRGKGVVLFTPLPPLDIHREVEDLAFRLAADHADILVSQARFRVEINFGRPTPSTRCCPRDRVGSMA